MPKQLRGVCCQCQEVVDIHFAGQPLGDEPDPFLSEAELHVCDSHDAYGSHCDGSGDCPQAICS